MEQSCLPYGSQEKNGGGEGREEREKREEGRVKESGDQTHLHITRHIFSDLPFHPAPTS